MNKKLIIVLLLSLFIAPLAKADMLFGFADGAGLYDSNGKLVYTCFPDETCVGLDNVIHTRTELGVGPVPVTVASSVLPANTPTITYVPVYVPSGTGAGVVAGSESTTSPITVIPDPSFTATSIPATGTQVTLGQWIVTNNTNTNTSQFVASINFNYNGVINQNEGFNNFYCGYNGGQNLYSTVLGKNSAFTNPCGVVPANSSVVISIVGNPTFSSSSQVSSLNPSLQIYQYSGSSLSDISTGTPLTIIY